MNINPYLNAAVQLTAPGLHKASGLAPVVNYGKTDGSDPYVPPLEFRTANQLGNMSANVVLAATLLGFAFDDYVSEKLKIGKGWAPAVGAVAGITATNAIAGATQGGASAGLGYLMGGASALLPLGIASWALNQSTENKTTVKVLAGLAILPVVVGVVRGVSKSE